MLRLLGLKLLDDCGACAHKVLRTMIFYPFCQDYREDGDTQYTIIIEAGVVECLPPNS